MLSTYTTRSTVGLAFALGACGQPPEPPAPAPELSNVHEEAEEAAPAPPPYRLQEIMVVRHRPWWTPVTGGWAGVTAQLVLRTEAEESVGLEGQLANGRVDVLMAYPRSDRATHPAGEWRTVIARRCTHEPDPSGHFSACVSDGDALGLYGRIDALGLSHWSARQSRGALLRISRVDGELRMALLPRPTGPGLGELPPTVESPEPDALDAFLAQLDGIEDDLARERGVELVRRALTTPPETVRDEAEWDGWVPPEMVAYFASMEGYDAFGEYLFQPRPAALDRRVLVLEGLPPAASSAIRVLTVEGAGANGEAIARTLETCRIEGPPRRGEILVDLTLFLTPSGETRAAHARTHDEGPSYPALYDCFERTAATLHFAGAGESKQFRVELETREERHRSHR